MNICMISGAFPEMKCGIGDFTSTLTRHLSAAGIAVDVLARNDPRVHPSDDPHIRISPVLSSMPVLDVPAIRKHVSESSCDLIHLQYPTWPYRRSLGIAALPALLRLATRKPVAVSFHEASMCHPLNKLRLLPAAIASSAAIATTPEDTFWLASKIPFLTMHLRHIPIGSSIPLDRGQAFDRAAFRKRHGIAPDEIVACYFGFVLRNKLLEDLLMAVRAVLNSGVRLRMVLLSGFEQTQGDYGANIKSLIQQVDLAQHLVITGYLPAEEVSHWMRASDFATLLFRDGASPRRSSILSAMEHALPLVTTSPNNQDGILHHGENILASPVGDRSRIAENIAKLATDASLRRKLSEASLRTARNFAWSEIAAQTIALYQRLLST